jgi:hypothetical protein
MLGEVLGWEYGDAELFKKHFLTVASYNLQHPSQFAEEAIRGLATSLHEHLAGRKSVAEIRAVNARAYEGAKRVRKPQSERRIAPRTWPMTIADVYTPEQPQGAADRVQAWAQSIDASLSVAES